VFHSSLVAEMQAIRAMRTHYPERSRACALGAAITAALFNIPSVTFCRCSKLCPSPSVCTAPAGNRGNEVVPGFVRLHVRLVPQRMGVAARFELPRLL
jgi:hypothetical protein